MHKRMRISARTEATGRRVKGALYVFSLSQDSRQQSTGHGNGPTSAEHETILLAGMLLNALCCLQIDSQPAILHARTSLE
jgi:hypothetical protein